MRFPLLIAVSIVGTPDGSYSWRVLTCLLAMACLVENGAAPGPKAAAQRPAGSSYVQIIERYQQGDDDVLKLLTPLDAKAIESGEWALLKTLERVPPSRGVGLLHAALMAHTDAAIVGRIGPTLIQWYPHLAMAQRYAELLASNNQQDPVAARWWLIVIGAMHAQRNYAQAMTLVNRALKTSGERAEYIFAAGITNELAWAWKHDAGFPTPFSGSLDDAEKAYGRLLATNPGLIDPRVRLGRVRILRGNNGGAIQTLAEIPDTVEPVLAYLARLFEGDALERQGSVEEARKRYERAIRLVPQAQSARLALAFTEYQDGARADAAARVRDTAADRGAADDGDPWFWYAMGFGAVAQSELTALRALVRQ